MGASCLLHTEVYLKDIMLAIGAKISPIGVLARRDLCCRNTALHRRRPVVVRSGENANYESPPKYTSPPDYNALRTGEEPSPVETMEVSANAPPP